MFFEQVTKELTVLPTSTMKIKVFTKYGLEDLSCSSQHIPADVDLEGEYDDLARPSSIGSASELTILVCRISVATVLYGD